MDGTCAYCGRDGRIIKGLCVGHYQQKWQRGEDLAPLRLRSPNGRRAECSFQGCDKRAESYGLCNSHGRQRKRGVPLASLQAKGTGHVTVQGYRLISKIGHPNAFANGKILDHRWVMAEHLGRALLPSEDVHHRNGDRLDNRIENLELWSSSQPNGQRVVDKLEWAREILATYGPSDSLLG